MSISVRKIQKDDLELIMRWRMDKDITHYMNTDPQLTMEKQLIWYDKISNDETVEYWLAEVDAAPAGVISLNSIDRTSGIASWGYYIGEKKLRSLKLAVSLEMSLYDYVFDVLGLNELTNEVFSLNEGVIKLHLACGSCITKEVKGEVSKNGVDYDITHISITNADWEQIRYGKKYEHIDFDTEFAMHHIGYAVNNMSSSIKMMKRIGYSQLSEMVTDRQRNVMITFMRNKSTGELVELVAPLNENAPVYNICNKWKGVAAPYHICYEVDDIEDAIRKLKLRKIILTEKPSPAPAIENRRVAFLFQKGIGMIELLEKLRIQS